MAIVRGAENGVAMLGDACMSRRGVGPESDQGVQSRSDIDGYSTVVRCRPRGLFHDIVLNPTAANL
jgi:hypothetical protein